MGRIKYTRRTASIVEDKYVRISHPKRDKIMDKLQDIPKFKWDGDCTWEIHLETRYVDKLYDCGFTFSKGLTKWWQAQKVDKKERNKITIRKIPGLGGKLYRFQLQGVNYIDNQCGRALIADEMGLGKTIQALAWLQLHQKKVKPVMVICPSFLKINWMRETRQWTTGMDVQILSGQTPYKITGDFVIINYDILPHWETELKRVDFKTIIVDEASYIKNNQAKRTKTFKKLSKRVTHLIALTGTPIENRPVEIYNIVYAIKPSLFPNWVTFVLDFCEGHIGNFGWDVSGSSNTLLLNQILNESIMIRRKKKDVLKDLPSKQFIKVPLQIDNRKEYTKAEKEFAQYMKEKLDKRKFEDLEEKEKTKLLNYAEEKEMEVEDGLTKELYKEVKKEKIRVARKYGKFLSFEPLKQLAVEGKMKEVIEWIEDFLQSGEKLVVFTYHQKTINTLMAHFTDALKIDGSVLGKKRQAIQDKFQNNPSVKLLFGQIQAAGMGITLTAASNVAVIQFPWNPGIYFQACDRVHRISQMHQVTIWNLVGVDTIEEKLIEILVKKEKVIGEVLDGKRAEAESVLSELMKEYQI